LFKRMFPDSAIAQKYACKRSKTTVIIKSVLATKFTEEPLKAAQEGPLTLCLDASSDTEDKLFLVLLRFCQGATGEITVGLLYLPVCNLGTAVISLGRWQNCVGFSCDKTSVNVGKHRSLKVHIENCAPKLYTLDCPCHLNSLCASKAASSLSVNVGKVLILALYYLDKSAKQKHLLKELAEFVNVEYRKILKLSDTCWLSMGKGIERILMIMPVLRRLKQEEATQGCLQHCVQPEDRVVQYILFVNSVDAMFENTNKLLQYEAPMIHMVHGSMMELLQKVVEASSLLATDYSDVNNQVPNHDLFIGFATKQYLVCTVELTESQVTVFYSDVRDFYTTAVKYIVEKFPLNDPILEFAGFLDDSHYHQYSLDNAVTLIQHLPLQVSAHEMDELHEEFTMYQLLNTDTTTMDSCREGGLLRPDILCNENPKIIYPGTEIPVSHSDEAGKTGSDTERLFSMVKKNKTDLRSSLSAETLCSLLKMKINCFKAT
uniref:DUF4371 domain-containing protein n=1 Tax=Latimeria chalumnae TaxID=7897 RepID=H3B615_LATCH